MPERWSPQPRERSAWSYRRAHRIQDLAPVGRYERSGFGRPDGYHGAYEERPAYRMPRGILYPPEPEGSGWPHELHHIPRPVEERHLRALRDRELARAVDAALYRVLPPDQADRVAVYADDAVITLAGRLDHPELARAAYDAATRVPGVRRIRDALSWPRRGRGRPPMRGRGRRRAARSGY
ncbi:MAG TPA: BON domain-containing protein [Longimicrobiales bacterium]